MDWLTGPFRYPFMQHALLAAVLVGITCAVLGVHVVQRRMAFIGDALAHTTLPGLVVAHLFGWSLSFGGLGAALATALLIGWASRRQAVKEDAAIGVVFTGMFALGVLLMSRTRSYRDLLRLLFGNVLGVTNPTCGSSAAWRSSYCSPWRCSTRSWNSPASTRRTPR